MWAKVVTEEFRLPGEKIAFSEEYLAGDNTYDDGESIRTALALCTCVLIITIGCLLNACRYLPEEEKNKVEIARSYGEPI